MYKYIYVFEEKKKGRKKIEQIIMNMNMETQYFWLE